MDQYIKLKKMTDLGLIWDATNPMTRQAKQGAMMLADILWNRNTPSTTTARFTIEDNIPICGEHSETQPSNTVVHLVLLLPHIL